MNNFDLKKYLIENKLTLNSQLTENVNDTVDTLYDKIINYMENNYSEYDIVEDDITTILNDVLKAKYTPEMFRAILKKIKTQSEYNLKENQPAPAQPKPDTETIPGTKPTTPKRRTLTPPDPNKVPETRPKAVKEGDDEIVQKIVAKYKELKK